MTMSDRLLPDSTYPFVYLASQNPRRQGLLRQIGVAFELLPRPDEDAEALEAELAGESADDYVVRVCAAKAGAARVRLVTSALPAAPVLVADTTVTIDGKILGKPASADEALAMLARLASRKHEVLTALAVVDAEGKPLMPALSRSVVQFTAVGAEALALYVTSGEPFGKAGAYAIQCRSAEFVARIDSSHSGIMGLPLFETAALLRAARVAF
ncbi:MAG: nucleoside triphosphate pyrophosphatase [Burkholderia sp.]